MEQVYKQTGVKPKDLDVPDIPEELIYLYEIFSDLSASRTIGFSPNPIGYVDIKAYQDLTGIRLKNWEIGAIRALDMAWFMVRSEANG